MGPDSDHGHATADSGKYALALVAFGGYILLLHPLEIVPLTPEPQGIHHRRPEVDYPVDRTYLPGYAIEEAVGVSRRET